MLHTCARVCVSTRTGRPGHGLEVSHPPETLLLGGRLLLIRGAHGAAESQQGRGERGQAQSRRARLGRRPPPTRGCRVALRWMLVICIQARDGVLLSRDPLRHA